MPKLRNMSGRETCAVLAAHGFVFVRQQGSHRIMRRGTDGGNITVSVPDHKRLATGTLSGIISRSQLSRSLFETK